MRPHFTSFADCYHMCVSDLYLAALQSSTLISSTSYISSRLSICQLVWPVLSQIQGKTTTQCALSAPLSFDLFFSVSLFMLNLIHFECSIVSAERFACGYWRKRCTAHNTPRSAYKPFPSFEWS